MRPISPGFNSAATSDANASPVDESPRKADRAPARQIPGIEGLPPAPRHAGQGSGPPRSSALGAGGGMRRASSTPNLVVVSNRVPDPTKPAAGGLAVALGDMPQEEKILWFGWSNQKNDDPGPKCVKLQQSGRTTFAQVDLSHREHDNYYAGFANSVLWPIFHEKTQLAELKPEFFEAYKDVNKMFASQLAPMLKEDDVLWIHDYHLIPLAEELRSLGCRHRMGFFNHIPLPPPEVLKEIPQHRELVKALFSYDLVGMQNPRDIENLRRYVEEESVGRRLEGTRVKGFGRSSSFKEFPIGIDVERFNSLAPTSRSKRILDKVGSEAGKRRLMIGVDRLDYSKGIPQRLQAFSDFLASNRHLHEQVTFVQIAAPTRESVEAYRDLGKQTQALVNQINSEFKTDTWEPVLYFHEEVEREALPAMFRMSPVGVVTPSADGMNLVAKEYVAVQRPEDPGVLVLSERAGAASQLSASILVPPEDLSAIARAYERAFTMPLDERQRRHAELLNNVKEENLGEWRKSYLDELHNVPVSSSHDDEEEPGVGAPSSSSQEHAAGGSQSGTGESRPFDEATREEARIVYERIRLYHGTGDASKQFIRLHGFTSDRSGFDGANAPPEDSSYHYLMEAKSMASRFAQKASSGAPSLVRTLGVRHDIPTERAMGVDKTPSDIPPQYIVGSKRSDPGPESPVFQKALERAGMQASEQSAGRLLRQVQSDSESDFSASSSDDER